MGKACHGIVSRDRGTMPRTVGLGGRGSWLQRLRAGRLKGLRRQEEFDWLWGCAVTCARAVAWQSDRLTVSFSVMHQSDSSEFFNDMIIIKSHERMNSGDQLPSCTAAADNSN